MNHPLPHWTLTIKGNARICVSPTVQSLATYVLLEQEDWYEREIDFIRSIATPETRAFDIGPTHGVYSVAMSRILDSGHIWTFCQDPERKALLEESIALNGAQKKVTVVQATLTDQAKQERSGDLQNPASVLPLADQAKSNSVNSMTLDEYVQEQDIQKPIDFVRLGIESEAIQILRGGSAFFSRQSPLVMFPSAENSQSNLELTAIFEGWGYSIYRLIPGIGILIEHPSNSQAPHTYLFACKKDLAHILLNRGFLINEDWLAHPPVRHLENEGEYWIRISEFPYAKSCVHVWSTHKAEIPEDFLKALGFALRANDNDIPASWRVHFLQAADSLLDRILQNPGGAHYSAWLLKIHLLHIWGYGTSCVHLCRQLIATFSRSTVPSWPFLPPSKEQFLRIPEGTTGEWIIDILEEFIELHKNLSSFFDPDPIPSLKVLLNNKNHDSCIYRRFALAAKKANLGLFLPPALPMLESSSPNSATWHEILGTGFCLPLLKSLPPIHIVDVGASTHGKLTEPYAPLMQMGIARVTGFEPDEKECQRLNELYVGTGNYRYYPYFVGRGGAATFYETNWYMTGSLYKPNNPIIEAFELIDSVTQLKAQHPVHTVSLAELADLGEIDMIKIDVQGAELDVFQGAGDKLDDVLVIWTEVEFIPYYENQPLFSEIDQFLRKRGFLFHTFVGISHLGLKPFCTTSSNRSGSRQAVWADAIFIRDFTTWERLSTLKLKKLAAVLDSVTKSYDLCYLALKMIDTRESSDLAHRYAILRNSL